MSRETSKILWLHRAILLLIAGVIHVAANIFYLKKYGKLSSSGADIWFYIGIAKGDYHLFSLDPLQILLPLLGNWPNLDLYLLLIVLSLAFHLISILLLHEVLRRIYHHSLAALGTALLFSCLSSSFLFTTATFIHQQTSIPWILLLIGLGHAYLKTQEPKKRSLIRAGIFLVVVIASTIGPDIWVVVAAAFPCWIGWKLQTWQPLTLRRIVGSLFLILFIGFFLLASKLLEGPYHSLVLMVRGIDLTLQRDLVVGDLQPLSWQRLGKTYSFFCAGFAALILFVWARIRFFELTLLTTALLFSTLAVRFYFLAELAFAFLLCWWLARFKTRWKMILICALGVILLVAHQFERGFTCLVPQTLVSALTKIRDDSVTTKKVWCNPSYGFLVKVIARAEPTTDVHHLNWYSEWAKTLTLPSREAIAELSNKGVTHLLLTSHDFREAWRKSPHGALEFGVEASGGLQTHLQKLNETQLKDALVYQAFTELFQMFPVEGLRLMCQYRDPNTGLQILVYKIGD